ncbi:hypothetical protein SELMODRAFT_407154 [Selaginella moellendorffii]|uniref:Uncharacterized protein n=1 Tax=Selaginella moellendorffii TaxID=88036 RepID=D8R431_SELML|nr:hypothetical protein SELMODRAFT_407154 [Selaginella moellendorffii]
MNKNLLTERALRDVFEITSYITVGTEDNPFEYGHRPPLPSQLTGKQFMTNPGKHGKTIDVYFQKEHPWVSDGDPYADRIMYAELQPERYKGFLTSDFSKRDEFSNVVRTNQYREQLKMDYKHSVKSLETMAKKMKKLEKDATKSERKPTRFEGPKYLYDVGKPGLSITPFCSKCHHETYYCQHRAAYCCNNPSIEKVEVFNRNKSSDLVEVFA